jgi:hypothetical protein
MSVKFFVPLTLLVLLLSAACGRPNPEDLTGLETFADVDAGHVNGPVSYPQTPPVGGPHHPLWQNCGIYDQPVPNEQAVHSLEHGAVWITYRPDLATEEVALLRELVRGKSHALLSPYPGLPAPVVASAWGLQLKLDGADDARLPFFVQKYHSGPQTPEPGAPCSGAVGEPIAGRSQFVTGRT